MKIRVENNFFSQWNYSHHKQFLFIVSRNDKQLKKNQNNYLDILLRLALNTLHCSKQFHGIHISFFWIFLPLGTIKNPFKHPKLF